MRAFAEADRRELRRTTAEVLRHRHPDALRGVPDGYVDGIANLALTTCTQNGFDQSGVVIDFANALVKDDQHPLPAEELGAKAGKVLRELRARTLFMTLQAMASAAQSASDPSAAADGADEEP